MGGKVKSLFIADISGRINSDTKSFHTRVNRRLPVLVGELKPEEAQYRNNGSLAARLVQPLKVFNRTVPLSTDDMQYSVYEDV